MNRQYIIMCGGYYEHFDRPKALMEYRGEPIVARTLRLLKKAGVDFADVKISATDPRFESLGVEVLRHENSYRYEDKKLKGYWLDAFYPHLPDEAKVTYLYGDVVYTKAAVDTIVNCTRSGEILFGTSAAKNKAHRNWGEPFGYKVDNYRRFMDGVAAVKRMWDDGKLNRHPITWELYRYLNGLDVNVQAVKNETYICIDDGTMDVDAPHVIEKLEKLETK